MGAVEQKLVDDAVDSHRPANELQCCVVWIAEYEVAAVKACQLLTADASRQRRDVVDVGLVDHGGHGLLDTAVGKLVTGVLVPDGFEVEVGPAHQRLQEGQRAGVCDRRSACAVIRVRGDGEEAGCCWVRVDSQVLSPFLDFAGPWQMRSGGDA